MGLITVMQICFHLYNVGGVGREFDQLDDCVSDPKQRSVPLFILNKEIYLPY